MRRPPKDSGCQNTGRGTGTVSIRDVAHAANVSIATVSRVINETGAVSAETAARVREVIRQIQYVPNPFAQGLITQESRVLGLLLPDIHCEFFSELLRGADAEAHALGYSLLVSTEFRGESARGAKGGFSFGLLDGIAMMITDANVAMQSPAERASTPTVVLDVDLHARGIDSVVIDNQTGARQATEHLLTHLAPDRLVFVGGGEHNIDTQQRARAFRDALAAAGHTPRSDQVVFGEYTVQHGRDWVAKMGRSVRGCGVLAGNDEIAIGILQAVQDSGMSVPGDCLLVGFDDTRLASLIRPRLSTVRVPMSEVGAAAVRLLVRRIHESEAEATCTRMTTSLVIRESSLPPK